jgi:hypothetical protein
MGLLADAEAGPGAQVPRVPAHTEGEGMKVCESSFEQEDSDHPGYSAEEVDFFTKYPRRVSLRRNLRARRYEVYEHRFDDHSEHVLFSHPELDSILSRAGGYTFAVARINLNDTVCDHGPKHAVGCLLALDEEVSA